MKKTIALLLTLLMVLSLAACGSQTTTEKSSTNTEQTEATTPVAEETEQPEESSRPTETEPVETEPAFDTGWASAEYVMPIPEPPFTQYTLDVEEHSGDAVYTIYTNSDEVGALTEADVLGYRDALKAAGFTQVDYDSEFNMESYFFEAHTEDGTASVIFECHIQAGVIGIIVETESAGSGTAFDTSWASNEFEALLPELPFTDRAAWTTSQESDSVYEITIIGLNTSAATNPSDSNEPDGADKDKLIAYLDSLSAYGFTVTETEEGYEWLVTDSAGNEFEFLCGDGGCVITITSAKTEGMESNSDTQLGSQFPTIPDGDWVEKETTTDTFCYLYAEEIDRSKIVDFCDMLIAEGYFLAEEDEPYMARISQTYKNDDGHMVKIRYEGKEDSGFCYLTINLED